MNTKDKLKIFNSITPERLLQNFGLENKIPVDIRKLIKILGIKIIPYDFSEMEKSEKYYENFLTKGYILGAAVTTEDLIGIFYKKDDLINRIRFTLAHELAHLCLHMHPDDYETHIDYKSDETSTKGMEFEANIFASKLLIPDKELQYAQRNLLMPSVNSLARIFGVSEAIIEMKLKYANLRII